MPVRQHTGSMGESGNAYFNDYTTTTSYVEISFGFPANNISFINDSETDNVRISWDGATIHHEMDPAEYKDIPGASKTSIYIRGVAGGDKVRITAT